MLFLRASNHQFVDKRIKNLIFKLSYLNSNFALTLGYLKPALNNLALEIRIAVSSGHQQLHFLTASRHWVPATFMFSPNNKGWLNENITSQQNSRPKWKMEEEWGSRFQSK